MGRKSHSKQTTKKNSGKENNRTIQKRKELSVLVDKVLRLTSIFQAACSLTKSWEHHLEIFEILKEISNVETAYSGKSKPIPRKANIEKYLQWLNDNEAQFEGVEISEFDGYELGLKAVKEFKEDSLILTVPTKVMMTEKNAHESELSEFIKVDPLLQNMPNITLALFLLLEKNNPDSLWKPYIDILPEKYSTILYFNLKELAALKPSPVFESSLKLYRSIARQYAYFYNKIHTLDLPVLKKLQEIFTFENYRWAVSTVMTRQNNIQLGDNDVTAFIPLWDMCNHEHGKITTDFNKDKNRGECYALRDFKPGEQIFIFYGARSNADLFLHNGFVYPNNQHDSLSLSLGISAGDPLRESKQSLLTKLGLAGITHYNLYLGDNPVSAELLAFIRIFNMNQEELTKWSSQGLPGDLVSSDAASAETVGAAIDKRAYTYLLTRCGLIKASYKRDSDEVGPESIHRKNIQLLKECEVQILDGAIKYLESAIQKLPTAESQ
ncbi:actin-histidine N-methyltransferase [Ostrinia furnacalis]|uniref:actin-histidine N-methyltransferase n=1 Tax=Ostrinia furnacalis TaxID=93504 RepID=UPI00103B6229|nr:actin-histidine N-methyltransferase [Ostrinia furnacalis]